MRTIIAFAIAPLVAPLVLSLYFGLGSPGSLIGFILIFGSMFAYGAALLVGIPLYLVLRRMGWHGPAMLALCGALIGVGSWMFFLFVFPMLTGGPSKDLREVFANLGVFDFLILPALLGAASGLLFWLIARPDRHRIAPPS
jgi:hypothetical protein